MSVLEVPASGGSREGRKEPSSRSRSRSRSSSGSSGSGNQTGQKALTSPSPQTSPPPSPPLSPQHQNNLNHDNHPRSPQEQQLENSAPEGPQPRRETQQQPQHRTGHEPSAISKLLATVLAPLIDILLSIYHRIASPTTPSPEAPPPQQPPPSREHQNQEDATMKHRAAKSRQGRKENVRPGLVAKIAKLKLREDPTLLPLPKGTILPFLPVHEISISPKEIEGEDPSVKVEREMHRGFIEQALEMARLALKTNETPVGCVLVCDGRVIAKGMNATNITRNGTRHAEYMALSSLFAYVAGADQPPDALQPVNNAATNKGNYCCNGNLNLEDDAVWDAVDPTRCHIYPYGQKLHPAPRVYESIIPECTLYVTVEPCVMCASMLRQLGIKRVFFGAVNDKFGGTGGVFRIHMNSPPASADAEPMRRVMDGMVIRISRDGTRTALKPAFEELKPVSEEAEETEGDGAKDQADERAKQQAIEQAEQQAIEQAKQQAIEQARQQAMDQARQQANVQARMKAREQAFERAAQLIDKQIGKRDAKRAARQAGKQTGRQAKGRTGEQDCISMGMSGTDRHNMWTVNKEPVDEPARGAMRREGDGGNVEPGYLAEGGWGRDEAVALLRQFYVQENGRAPVPRKKEGRAARLAAMLERDGMSATIDLLNTAPMPKVMSAPVTTASTPMPLGQLGGASNKALGMNGNNAQIMADGGQENGKEGSIVDVPTPMSDVT
ncbi:hypothetical protein GGTG_04857 [Gaeumannomyces tritici R3-111a-1]|uniref:CMP/dCMP-type deaminase domain-containing protein n=1 Tax=Gaeumannomyces tritici (strain R3-111a-1) TaxID=644352 RepID=J3NUA3_GAET3|nr:hypothetical protein GGTG_04857 [Gaeumannomyces tritici R3-111a-1]EJT79774.1 hypothetical protein GGTG_04857 [Gaeumannomyces tritici R3-111a-1]